MVQSVGSQSPESASLAIVLSSCLCIPTQVTVLSEWEQTRSHSVTESPGQCAEAPRMRPKKKKKLYRSATRRETDQSFFIDKYLIPSLSTPSPRQLT